VSRRILDDPERARARSLTERFLILVDRHNHQRLVRWQKITQSGP
jgi:hypothetical protein